MKYIKTYENIILRTKKYIVFHSDRKDMLYLFIAENIDDHYFTRIYECVNGVIKKLDPDSEYLTVCLSYKDDNNIIYQSDTLEECLETLKIVQSTNKYNL